MRDRFLVVWLVVAALAIGLSVWLRVSAPCSYMGWMPAKEIPGRCLNFVRK